MTIFVPIDPGEWALAFHNGCGPYHRTVRKLLESYAFHHWMDSTKKEEIFLVHQVQLVMPKTYLAVGASRYVREGERLSRACVIAGCKSEADALGLRDKLFAIGVETGEKIEKDMYRRIEKFAARDEAKAVRKVHRCLPHTFGRAG